MNQFGEGFLSSGSDTPLTSVWALHVSVKEEAYCHLWCDIVTDNRASRSVVNSSDNFVS
jgi:hypothetical protein